MTGAVARQVRPRAEARPRDPPDGWRWPAVVGAPRSRLLNRAAFGRRRGPDGCQAGESKNGRGLSGCGRRRCPAAERGHPTPRLHTPVHRETQRWRLAEGRPACSFQGGWRQVPADRTCEERSESTLWRITGLFFFLARGVWKVHPCYKHRVPKEGEGKEPSHLLLLLLSRLSRVRLCATP